MWPKCHVYCWFSRLTGREYHEVCCYFSARNSYSPYRAVQHTASPHLLRDPLVYRALIPDDFEMIYQSMWWFGMMLQRSNTILQWFVNYYRMLMEFLLLYSLFLNPIEEFYSAWRWKVYDCQPHTQIILLTAMDAAREDISADAYRGLDKTFQKLSSTLHCKGRYLSWYGWEWWTKVHL